MDDRADDTLRITFRMLLQLAWEAVVSSVLVTKEKKKEEKELTR